MWKNWDEGAELRDGSVCGRENVADFQPVLTFCLYMFISITNPGRLISAVQGLQEADEDSMSTDPLFEAVDGCSQAFLLLTLL